MSLKIKVSNNDVIAVVFFFVKTLKKKRFVPLVNYTFEFFVIQINKNFTILYNLTQQNNITHYYNSTT